ncbi:amidohydrolase family protein [Phreatobacter aquaticus]|uniref:Amidohydrolase family protein n=1 Tax=Phreatobacter aquaticus TaxID=2570229 RepID=A0A4D7QBK5_9HYPH|nr:amidohydrolase family protein [Phreatobacter aquaticus]QCK84538.1 amidohydrolase family protein [Phreatobacter aquaticus]
MSLTHFRNFRLLDPAISDELVDGYELLVEGDRIKELSDKPIKAREARTINCGKRTLMPGLIDCHVHVIATQVNIGQNALTPDALIAYRSARIMKGMLDRGFTTVRDLGGATYPLVQAQQEGLIEAPRLIIPGKALSQTGGHGDSRSRYDNRDPATWTQTLGSLGRIADGVDAVRIACREEIKRGAHFIKIMANGGVASPNDPIHFLGYSREEILASVEEAQNAGTYVAAHLYTDEAIRRAVECGVHSLEHCNLITSKTAKFAAENKAIACPTLVTYEYLGVEGPALGLDPISVSKVDTVRLAGMKSLEIMHKAKLTMAFGSDLLGEMHRHQSEEFVIRGRVLPAIEVIRSTSMHAAKLLRKEGELGTVRAGAYADIVLVDGNPLKDLALLTQQGANLALIMQGGRVHKDALN